MFEFSRELAPGLDMLDYCSPTGTSHRVPQVGVAFLYLAPQRGSDRCLNVRFLLMDYKVADDLRVDCIWV